MQGLSKVLGHRGAGSKPRLTQPSGGAAAEPTCHKGLGPDKAAHQDSKPQAPRRPPRGHPSALPEWHHMWNAPQGSAPRPGLGLGQRGSFGSNAQIKTVLSCVHNSAIQPHRHASHSWVWTLPLPLTSWGKLGWLLDLYEPKFSSA